MADSKPRGANPSPPTVTVQMPAELMRQLERVRAAIADDLGGVPNVSRGDVVRLALRRLVLAYIARCSQVDPMADETVQLWDSVVDACHRERTCPSWLLPGSGDDAPKPRKKGR
jgi:hypothetical protein